MNRTKRASDEGGSSGESIELGRSDPLFVKTPEWILVSGISPPAQALYSMLRAHVNRSRKDDVSWPGLELLAEMLGYSKKHSVIKYVRELEDLGAVTVKKVPCAVGKRNHYVVHETPPPGYTGFRTLNELHDDFKARKRAEREARDRDARKHFIGGSAAGAASGSAAAEARGDAAGAAHNQRNPTRRSERDEITSSDASAADGQRASSQTEIDQQSKQGPRIYLPRGFDKRTDAQAVRYLVSASIAAIGEMGLTPAPDAADRLGTAIKATLDEGVKRAALATLLENTVVLAGTSNTEWGWLGTRDAWWAAS